MKAFSIVFVVTVSYLFLNSWSYAALKSVRSERASLANAYNISVNPLWLPLGVFDGQFDFAVSESNTVGLYLSLFHYSSGTTRISSTGIGARLNHYFNHHRLSNGWYVSPFFQVIPSSWSESFGSVNYTSFSFGGVCGHHWIFSGGFNIMFGVGISYYTAQNSAVINGRTVNSDHGFSGVWPTGELRLGYTF